MPISTHKLFKTFCVIIPFIILAFLSGCYRNRVENYDTLTIGNKSCPLKGSANSTQDVKSNILKNRWKIPTASNIDTNFTWDTLFEEGDNPRLFDTAKAGRLRGYVAFVTPQKGESCNCDFKDNEFSDIHIHLAQNEEALSLKWQHVIVEVTPRLRELMKLKKEDWTVKNLQKLIGKEVEIEGWLFYDWEHGDKAYLYNGDEQKSWRATCWEIHPITSLKVINTMGKNDVVQ